MIDKVHGLQATNISLNDRFTLLATTAPIVRVARPRRRSSGMYSLNYNTNRLLIDQIAQRLGQQSKRLAVQQRLGLTRLRRFGSEGNLNHLQRSNSFNNLNQNSIKNRVAWRQSNGNLSRASFRSVSPGPWRGRGFRRRGGRMGLMRGRFRGSGVRQQLVGRLRNQQSNQQSNQRGRGRGRGRGRPARGPTQTQKTVPTKEELDLQLDQYMASTKTALDKELDNYMKTAMEE